MRLGWGAGAIADYPWHYDGVPWSVDDTLRTLKLMKNLQGNWIALIDTAYRYGKGMSERLIGFAKRVDIISIEFPVITKIPLGTYDEMVGFFNESLSRLTFVPNGVLLHNPDLSDSKAIDDGYKFLLHIKKLHAVKYIGISTEPCIEAAQYISQYSLNCIEFPYSKQDRRAEESFFPYLPKNIFMIANRVLGGPARGTGKYISMVEENIRFVIENGKQIHVALIGTSNPTHLAEAVRIFNESSFCHA